MTKIVKPPPFQPPTPGAQGPVSGAGRPVGATPTEPRQPIGPGNIGLDPGGRMVALYAVIAPVRPPVVQPLYGIRPAPSPEQPPIRALYGAPVPINPGPGIRPLYGITPAPKPKPPVHLLYGVWMPGANQTRMPDFPGSLLPWTARQGKARADSIFQGTLQKLPAGHPGQRAIDLVKQLIASLGGMPPLGTS